MPDSTCWIASVAGRSSEEVALILKQLLLEKQVFGFHEEKPVKINDRICFYSIPMKALVGHAVIDSFMKFDPSVISASFPWIFSLKNPYLYLEFPIVLDIELRRKLDAFKKQEKESKWSWFVWKPHRITEHDFGLLNRT